ncbi:phytoene synthase, partial [Thiocystis minor]|nr:phytoene synthase [Thiocystis minor]
AVVPVPRKLQLLAPILGTAVLTPRYVAAPALAETHFLVEAVVAATPQKAVAASVGNRVIWVLELFEQLEERERALSLR